MVLASVAVQLPMMISENRSERGGKSKKHQKICTMKPPYDTILLVTYHLGDPRVGPIPTFVSLPQSLRGSKA